MYHLLRKNSYVPILASSGYFAWPCMAGFNSDALPTKSRHLFSVFPTKHPQPMGNSDTLCMHSVQGILISDVAWYIAFGE